MSPLPRSIQRAVARLKPHVPERLWPLLLSVRSFTGDGPLVGVPSFRRVLVLAPHPDDETVGCGGTIARLADAGGSVVVVFASDGEATRGAPMAPGEVARRRREEAEQACGLLGVASTRFLSRPDGGLLDVVRELSADVRAVVREVGPQAVFLPWYLDGHDDHRALNLALADAGLDASIEVWGYETWTPLPANRLVDITPVVSRKEAALGAHATAALAFDTTAILGLNRYRSLHGLTGRGHAEAFLAAPAPTYVELVRTYCR